MSDKEPKLAESAGMCRLCGLDILVGHRIQTWEVNGNMVAAHVDCVTSNLAGGQMSASPVSAATPASGTEAREVEPDFSKLPAEIVAFVKGSQYAWDAWQESGAQDGSIPDIQWWMCAAIADYTRQLSSGGEGKRGAPHPILIQQRKECREWLEGIGYAYLVTDAVLEACVAYANYYTRQLPDSGEVVEAARKYAARLGFQYWTIVEAAGFAAEYARQLKDKLEAAEQARKVAEDKVVELESALAGIALAPGSRPLVCYKCGPSKGGHAAVYQYCHSCNKEAGAAQGMVATLREVIQRVADAHDEEGDYCEIDPRIVDMCANAVTLSAPIAEAHDRQVASKALPEDIMDSVDEYLRLSAISPENFPGHRSTALLNLVAHIGERLVGVVARARAQDIADGKRAVGSYLAERAAVLRARAQDFEDRKRDAGL